MKKRLMPVLLAFLTAFTCLVFTANADELTPSEGLKFTEYSTYFGVSGIGSCADTDIVIPAEHNGKPVTSIEARAFERNTGLTSVVIPDTVTTIKNYSFNQCTALTSVTIGNGVSSIGSSSFAECGELTSVSFGSAVESIGLNAFEKCEKLTVIELPDSVISIDDLAFADCRSLTRVSFGSGVESIGEYAFSECRALTEIDLPSSVRTIADFAFYDCEGLEIVRIGSGVESIGKYAFYGCEDSDVYYLGTAENWASVEVGEYNTAVETTVIHPEHLAAAPVIENETDEGFDKAVYCSVCGAELSRTYHDKYVSLGGLRYLFNGDFYSVFSCENEDAADAVIVPEINGYPVREILSGAFEDCTGITRVTVPNSVTSVGSDAFADCAGIVKVYYLGTAEEWNGVVVSDGNTYLTENIVFHTAHTPSDPEIIGTDESGYIEAAYCTECGAEVSRAHYAFSEGLEFTEHDTYCELTGIGTCTDKYLRIPEYYNGKPVASIGYQAFYDNVSITGVTIPSTVTKIDEYAFHKCTGITNLVIPDSVTDIGKYAFYYCSGLTDVKISDRVSNIGVGAFEYCGTLTSLTIQGVDLSIGDGAFGYCYGLKSVTLGDGVTSLDGNVFAGGGTLESITVSDGNTKYHSAQNCLIETESKTLVVGCNNSVIPDDGSVTSIGDYAFLLCEGLKNAVIPESVTAIGSSAFRRCEGLESITLSDSVTSIGDYAFYMCSVLESITLPEGVTSIGDYAFDYCSKLTNINIPDGVTSIGNRVFMGCSVLAEITLPDGVTSIGDYAFYNCEKLTGITIPKDTTSIGKAAFAGCTDLETFTVSDGNTKYYSAQNCLIETESKTLVAGCRNSEIPNDGSVTSIGEYAFYNCSGLETVTIPGTIKSIGKSAFSNCSGLTIVRIFKGVSVIGENAFLLCRNIGKVYFIGTASEWRSIVGHYESGLETYIIEYKPLKDYSFKGATVTTAGYLIANYYVRIDNVSDLDDIAVRFTRNGVSTTVYGSEAVDGSAMINDGNTYYYFSYEVPAKNMGDIITAEIISTYVDAVHDVKDDYSIKTYYMNKLADGSDKMKAVSVAALNYGAAAQVYFGYDTDHLVNEGLTEEQKSLGAAPETPYTSWNKYAKFGELSNVSALGTTLVLKADTRIRFYFTVTDDSGAIVTDDVSEYTFEWGMTEMTPVYSPSYEAWYVEVSGIAAKSLDTAQIVTVSNGHESLSVGYSPTTYVFNKYDSTTPGMADLVRSMYLYYIAAYYYAKK